MQGKNHVALALAVPLTVAWLVNDPTATLPGSAVGWGALMVGSLAPDIDGGGSIAYWGDFLPRKVTPPPLRALLNGVGKTVSDVVRSIFGHRQALHWPSWGLFVAAAGSVLGVEWLLWFGLGYLLHIFGDSLTKSGVPLFGPFSTRDISFTPMITGSMVETLFGALLWLFVGWHASLALMSVPYNDWLYQLLLRFGGEFVR